MSQINPHGRLGARLNPVARLDLAIRAAGIPIAGVSVRRVPPPQISDVRIDFQSTATQAQKDQAYAIVVAFDWSPEADEAAEVEIDKASARASLDVGPVDAHGEFIQAALGMLLDDIDCTGYFAAMSAGYYDLAHVI